MGIGRKPQGWIIMDESFVFFCDLHSEDINNEIYPAYIKAMAQSK